MIVYISVEQLLCLHSVILSEIPAEITEKFGGWALSSCELIVYAYIYVILKYELFMQVREGISF